jgi:glycosyltransferase involved in cell wall biosynthesis
MSRRGDSIAQPKQIGIYNLNMAARGGGEKLTLVLASHLSRLHDVRLFKNAELDVDSLEETFAVDLSRVKFTEVTPLNVPFQVLAKIRGARPTTFSLHHYQQIKKLNLDLFINVSHGSVLPCPAAKGVFICMFPHHFGRHSESTGWPRMRRRFLETTESMLSGAHEGNWLDSYAQVIAISKFSAEWVERLWHRKSEVVYPPADDMGPPDRKSKMILHVGRFTPPALNHHHKAQEVLLETFKDMRECYRNGWELHFAGNVGAEAESIQFASSLVQKAQGHPVKFHFNAKFDELRELYRRAAIYWHATGVGTDARRHPELQEHFGITTVEAMSAGAVPAVIASGGQTEIVSAGVNGMCWNDPAEMVQQTELLMNDSKLCERLSTAAIDASKKFDRASFIANMDRSITKVLGR